MFDSYFYCFGRGDLLFERKTYIKPYVIKRDPLKNHGLNDSLLLKIDVLSLKKTCVFLIIFFYMLKKFLANNSTLGT